MPDFNHKSGLYVSDVWTGKAKDLLWTPPIFCTFAIVITSGEKAEGMMDNIADRTTLGEAFRSSVAAHGDGQFFVVPANSGREYLKEGFAISYTKAGRCVSALAEAYRRAGYGVGHRVATLLENRPEYVFHKLALNGIGVCCVPINPDYRPSEIAYLLEHSESDLILTLGSRVEQMRQALAQSSHTSQMITPEQVNDTLVRAMRRATQEEPGPDTPASILYTSGTTGRPKGCVLSHGYEIASGAWYAALGGEAGLRAGMDRIYNPLPLYHVNAAVLSLMGAMRTGCCQIQPDRFHPRRWWRELVETRASIVHYLGIIAPLLMSQPPNEDERRHSVRFGIGAGIEPELHSKFEARFGFPMIEIWGMTEMVRVLADNIAPRRIGSRAFGRAVPAIEVRVVDDQDQDVPDGTPGEMVIRHSAATPRRGFFSGYLNDEEATESAWRSGWFHSGDVVRRGTDGMLHFVDRKKNIIRRSGENIAAAEVEAVLLAHSNVLQAAVLPVKDELREEEVLACVVLKHAVATADAAPALFRHCMDRLAYFKVPGWIHIVGKLPTTGTQKIQKHVIYPGGTDPRSAPGIVDLREKKRRQTS